MSMRENLKNEREEFWKKLISKAKSDIEKTVREYQESLEYGPAEYELELYVEKKDDLMIYLMMDEDDEVLVATFENNVAVMEFLSRICIVLELEGIEIFDKTDYTKFSTGKRITLCKGKILLF